MPARHYANKAQKEAKKAERQAKQAEREEERENKKFNKELDKAETDSKKKNCTAGGHGTWIAGKCNCKKGYTLSGTHCVETAKKEEADKKLKQQIQSVGAQLEEKRQAQFKDTDAQRRNESLHQMNDASGLAQKEFESQIENSRPAATLSTTPPGQ